MNNRTETENMICSLNDSETNLESPGRWLARSTPAMDVEVTTNRAQGCKDRNSDASNHVYDSLMNSVDVSEKRMSDQEKKLLMQLEKEDRELDESINRQGLSEYLGSAASRMNILVEEASMDFAIDTLMEEGEYQDNSLRSLQRSIVMGKSAGNITQNTHSNSSFVSEATLSTNDGDQIPQEIYSEVQLEEDLQVYEPSQASKGNSAAILVLWFYGVVSLLVAAQTYSSSIRNEESVRVFGIWVALARSGARLCNFNAALVLIPVSRHLMTWMQSRRRLRKVVNFDAAHLAHRIFGTIFCLSGVAHTVSHFFTYTHFAQASEVDLQGLFGEQMASSIPSSFQDRLLFLAKHRASITGIGMQVCMFAAVAVLGSRRKKFNKFWYFHHLLVVMLVLLCIHGSASFISATQTLYWLTVPLIVYLTPRVYREFFTPASKVVKAETCGDVLALTVQKPEYWRGIQKAGMYAMINVPTISHLEWHPVTISSAPFQSHLIFHISCTGDWTRRVKWIMMGNSNDNDGQHVDIPIRLEGPFGAPSQGTRDFDVVMLIGAGIGVTPMISTLRSLLHRPSRLRKVYFYWTVRDSSSFRLFNNLMDSLYEQDTNNRLEIRHFLTSAKPDSLDLGSLVFQHAADQVHAKTDMDIRLGHRTRQPMGIGRPNWKEELKGIMDETEQIGLKKTGVFFCGPDKMGSELQTLCTSLSDRRGSCLHFRKEIF